MSVEKAICALLTGDSAVQALIAGRLHPIWLPQDMARPAVTYQEIAGSDGLTTDGALGLVDGRFQFTCWADTHPDCIALCEAIRQLFTDYAGTVADVTIQHTRVLNRGDIAALSAEAEQLTRFGKFLDVQISYNE